ncbi:hypothetical protein ACFQU9_09010 [Actinomadura namibiensis]|uniref:Chromosome segregation ATPase n=1 Tax=Actinomadura namibiensis TaxID=182080 RepID=A0A7W3LVA6_ACTNM|nr:serine/threonine protein kinase [Actinomadura namibiensis]MBA8954842.1 hypothetical protein [Actinomadura namibiensis]
MKVAPVDEEGRVVPRGVTTADPAGAGEVRAGDPARAGDPVAMWPCAGCGRPVPQPVRGARTVRYCQDGGGICEQAARARREQGRQAPGLTGQVALTWEMVERLEEVADRLATSLATDLSVAGVERRLADLRAELSAEVAVAQQERDASQRQAEAAWREVAAARARADAAAQEAAEARAAAEEAAAERDTARAERREARDAAEQATAARMAAEAERDRIGERENELLAALEAARSELVTLHARLSESETIAEGQRIEAAAARQSAEDLRATVRGAEAERGRAVAERDQTHARLQEAEQLNWQLGRANDELRGALAALTAERDAARAEAERARRSVDLLTRSVPANAPRPDVDLEPPTGLHSVNDFRLPHAG